MNQKTKWILILTSLLSTMGLLAGGPDCSVSACIEKDSGMVFPINGKIEVLEDPEGKLDIAAIRRSDGFRKSQDGEMTHGYTNAVTWIRIQIRSDHELNGKYAIHFRNSSMDFIDYYPPGARTPVQTGDMRPFNTRPVNSQSFYFPIYQKAGTRDHYLRLETIGGSMRFPLSVENLTYSVGRRGDENLISGIIFGTIGILALYNLLVHFSFNDRAYFYYFLFTGGITVYLFSMAGYGFQYIWPEYPFLNYVVTNLGSGTAMVTAVMFTRSYLQAKRFAPGIYKFGNILVLISLIHMIVNSMVFSTPGLPGILIPIAIMIYAIITVIRILLVGFRPALFFLISMIGFNLGIIPLLLELYGFSIPDTLRENGMNLGVGAMSIMLSMALSYRIRIIKGQEETTRRKIHSLQNEFSAARKIQNELLQLPEDYNSRLNRIHMETLCIPASDVAGDLYLMEIPNKNQLSVCVADVVGHGISAALVSSLIKSSYHLQSRNYQYPEKTLEGMNQFLCTHLKQSFATAQVVFIDSQKMTLSLSSGGHPPAVLVRDGSIEKIRPEGRPLGVDPEWKPLKMKKKIQAGDRIVLYTDGIIEANPPGDNNTDFEERFYELILETRNETTARAKQLIREAVSNFSGKLIPDDDVTLVLIDIS